MIIFISPAKTFRKTHTKSSQFPVFRSETQILVKKLKKLDTKEIKSFMKVSDKVALQTYQYYQNFNQKITPAIYTYYGHQFRHIDMDSLAEQQLNYLNDHLYIMSGLYGLLKPLDVISYYRLEMQDKTFMNLYDFWSPKIITYIKKYHQDEVIINLASKEYGQIISDLDQTYTIEFYQLKNNTLSIHSMEAKKLRGLFASHIIKHQLSTLDQIKALTIENYHFQSNHSNEKTLVFIKGI